MITLRILVTFLVCLTGFSALALNENGDEGQRLTSPLLQVLNTQTLPSVVEQDSASLKCLCQGGPGNYPYECEPIPALCHGGPGNYPYQCLVCPEK